MEKAPRPMAANGPSPCAGEALFGLHPVPAAAASRRLTVTNLLDARLGSQAGSDVRRGLASRPKWLPSKYFYDAAGSRLFDEICLLPEYYPTRTEMGILRSAAAALLAFFEHRPGSLVEFGCGADLKIRQLLDRCPGDRIPRMRYVPVDISGECLLLSARRLLADFPQLSIHGLIADFTRHLQRLPAGRKMILFFGGTFGNFSLPEGIALLARLAAVCGPEDRLVLGLDMVKDRAVLEAAYNDSRGVTAAFNLNMLRHVNRLLDADFDPRCFEHLAFWNQRRRRIEMHLRARRRLVVHVGRLGQEYSFGRGETVRTEISQKFTRASARARFSRAGWQDLVWHTDPAGWFSLVELRKAAPAPGPSARLSCAAHAAGEDQA